MRTERTITLQRSYWILIKRFKIFCGNSTLLLHSSTTICCFNTFQKDCKEPEWPQWWHYPSSVQLLLHLYTPWKHLNPFILTFKKNIFWMKTKIKKNKFLISISYLLLIKKLTQPNVIQILTYCNISIHLIKCYHKYISFISCISHLF